MQERLNLLMGTARPHLVVDGLSGPMTKAAIGDFQKSVLAFKTPDERVDPAAKTIKALNEPGSAAKWQSRITGPTGPEDPAEPDPKNPAAFDSMPKIAVLGTGDAGLAFDTYPPPPQILTPAYVRTRLKRDGAWLMVPEGGRRRIQLGIDAGVPVKILGHLGHGVGADGTAWSFRRERLLRATVEGQSLLVHGITPCQDCKLDIVQNRRHLRLYVSVKPRRIIPLFVFYVEHGPILRARLSPAEFRAALRVANDILVPQSNVELRILDDRVLAHEEIGKRLGLIFRVDPFKRRKDELRLIEKFARKSSYRQSSKAEPAEARNIFVVRDLAIAKKDSPVPDVPLGVALSDTLIVVDDRSFGAITLKRRLAETIAHEIGHSLLGLIYRGYHMPMAHWGHNPFSDALMHPWSRGTKLYRVEIEEMNPTSSALMYQGDVRNISA